MANRIVTAAVTGETIKLSEKSAGAAGSFNAVSLSFTFDSKWDGTTKIVQFLDTYGANPANIPLTVDLLVSGAYIVPIPAEPLAYAGEMNVTVRGVDLEADGVTAERIIMSASTTMKVLNSLYEVGGATPVEPTPTQTELLQAEIDDLISDIVAIPAAVTAAQNSATAAALSETAAELAETNAELAETNAETAQVAAELAETHAETAESNASGYATNASNSALEASGSATTAVNAKTDAQTAQTAAELAETHAETAESNAGTHATNAGLSATAAATSATNADNAKVAAQTAQTNAELAETNAETAEVNAETAETNAVAAKNAAELALTHAPYIDDTNGNWFIWNATTSAYVDSGTYATGAVYQAEAPTGVVLWIDSDDDAISSVTKADIGLANVDNTADTAKPVSTAQQTALNAKVNTSAIVNDLTTGGTAVPLSAEQGKTLSASISELKAEAELNATNLIAGGNFPSTSGWTAYGVSVSAADGILSITENTANAEHYVEQSLGSNHFSVGDKVYVKGYVEQGLGSTIISYFPLTAGGFQSVTSTIISGAGYSSAYFTLGDIAASAPFTRLYVATGAYVGSSGVAKFKYVAIYNLTKIFGANNEPTVAQMDTLLAQFPNGWLDGAKNIAENDMLMNHVIALSTKINEKTSYGVYSGLGVTQQTVADMTVKVATGTIYMDTGTRFTPTANNALAITAADATNPRIDIVYVNSSGVIAYLSGTAGASPSAPSVPTGGQKLAEISVAANVTTIVTANIADKKKTLVWEAYTTPTLQNGNSHGSRTTRYRKNSTGKVNIVGQTTTGSLSTIIFILPAGYRPTETVEFMVRSTTATIGYGYISTGGALYITTGTVGATYLFDGLSFETV